MAKSRKKKPRGKAGGKRKSKAQGAGTTPSSQPTALPYEKALTILRDKDLDNGLFWKNFVRALDAEPRDDNVVRGISGIEHKLLGIGVNDKDRRLVLVSDTPTAEHAALMQVDVAATSRDLNVVIARPAAFDLTGPVRKIVEAYGSPVLDKTAIEKFNELGKKEDDQAMRMAFGQLFGAFMLTAARAFTFTPLTGYSQFQQFVSQLSLIDFTTALSDENGQVDLKPFAELDITLKDRELGICPVPLYKFEETQMETILSATNAEPVTEVLHDLDIHQYFFPEPEDVGLGLVDRGITNPENVETALTTAPKIGHPYAGSGGDVSAQFAHEIVQRLIDNERLEEAEVLMVTEDGAQLRVRAKAKPSEAFIVKLLRAAFPDDFHVHLPPS